MPITKQHIKRFFKAAAPLMIFFAAGTAIGLAGGFLTAWILCLKFLAFMVINPFGPYP